MPKRKYRLTHIEGRDRKFAYAWKYESFLSEEYGWHELRNLSMRKHLRELAIPSGKDVFEIYLPIPQ